MDVGFTTHYDIIPKESGTLRVESWLGSDDTGEKVIDNSFEIASGDVDTTVTLTIPNPTVSKLGDAFFTRFSGVDLDGGTQVGSIGGIYDGEDLPFLRTRRYTLTGYSLLSEEDLPRLSGFKIPVKVATTANLDLDGTETIDGIAVVAGDRVLVKNQTAPSENGIYVASTGAWSRADDSTTQTGIVGCLVHVIVGTANGGTSFVNTNTGPVVVDTTSITYAEHNATDLSQHSVTELNDVTNAGSGAIITSSERTKLSGIATGAEVNVQADWNETDTGDDAFIQNKPSLAPSDAEANVQADWDETDSGNDAFIQNKPSLAPSDATENLVGTIILNREFEIVSTITAVNQFHHPSGSTTQINLSISATQLAEVQRADYIIAQDADSGDFPGNELVTIRITSATPTAVGSDPLNPDYYSVVIVGTLEKGFDEQDDILDPLAFGAVGDDSRLLFLRMNRTLSIENADWNQALSNQRSFIRNKPDVIDALTSTPTPNLSLIHISEPTRPY